MTDKITPAFPVASENCQDLTCEKMRGMSLRDYFAAKAMQMKFGAEHSSIPMTDMANICYEMADAMLEARK